MIRFTYRFGLFIFLFGGIFCFAQEKKQFSSVSGILQRIVPNIKTDTWILIHQSGGQDKIIKESGAKKEYVTQSTGFNIGIEEEGEFYYIVYFSAGKAEYVTNLDGLRTFVGKVDGIEDAAVIASTEGYIIDEEFKDLAGNYSEDANNYYLDLGKLTSRECPYQKKHFTIAVNKSSGNITNIKDNGSYIELYYKKCTNNPRLLKLEKKEESKDDSKKKPATKRR
ncbi:hypothetical protein SAMN05443633_114107 [Chryseobacterium arachidis]|uniref:Uncharacterized protein n=1 Tax=Chryseobacterium arachidis TaxID=1416778 RepID=A0A1M5JG11_9FLAO|nr:hypothetical protein [Chryseobacterium arachidis]SHG39451.1 hypothetical protein SAMN05443633_114107 [Chryseobacterium arachidis]